MTNSPTLPQAGERTKDVVEREAIGLLIEERCDMLLDWASTPASKNAVNVVRKDLLITLKHARRLPVNASSGIGVPNTDALETARGKLEFMRGVLDADGLDRWVDHVDIILWHLKKLGPSEALSPSPARVADREAIARLINETESVLAGLFGQGVQEPFHWLRVRIDDLLSNGGGTRTQGSEG